MNINNYSRQSKHHFEENISHSASNKMPVCWWDWLPLTLRHTPTHKPKPYLPHVYSWAVKAGLVVTGRTTLCPYAKLWVCAFMWVCVRVTPRRCQPQGADPSCLLQDKLSYPGQTLEEGVRESRRRRRRAELIRAAGGGRDRNVGKGPTARQRLILWIKDMKGKINGDVSYWIDKNYLESLKIP